MYSSLGSGSPSPFSSLPLNPRATGFQPIHTQTHQTPATQIATSRINSIEDEPTLPGQVIALRDAVVEELCLIRRDLGFIMNGGWQLTIGPWQMIQPARNEQDVLGIRRRISRATGGEGVLAPNETSTSPQTVHDKTFANDKQIQTPIEQDSGKGRSTETANLTTNKLALTNASISNEPSTPRLIIQEAGIKKSSDVAVLDPTTKWMPLGLRKMKPLNLSKVIPLEKQEPFTWDFLNKILQGIEHSPGVYIAPESLGTSILSGRTYYMIDRTHEPYMPQNPGMHGAKLTAFFNNEETAEGEYPNYDSTPLFMTNNGRDYFYFGTYSQTRWSDKLDVDRMNEVVPEAVKAHHAAQLVDPARPAWITKALMRHFWPAPEFHGVAPHAFDSYVTQLKAWKRDARMRVGLLKKETILNAFGEVSSLPSGTIETH